MSDTTHQQIDNDVKNNPILIYMKGEKDMPQCGFSNAVVQIFKEIGKPFETRNVLADNDLRQTIKEYSNWPTIPQVYINGQFIGGCDIVLEMHQKGELAPMLENK